MQSRRCNWTTTAAWSPCTGAASTRTRTAGPEVRAPVSDVVNAIHRGDQVFALFPSAHGHLPDRRFMTVSYDNGWETVALEGPPTHEREVHDMDRL